MHIFFKIKMSTALRLVSLNMLKNSIQKVSTLTHMVSKIFSKFLIYIDGLLYFVEGASIGSDFGFPRLGIRKRFKWKKMNFTTDLPKRDPLVSYIVASAVKCEKFFPGSNDDGPVYRMHAVILKKRDPKLDLPATIEAHNHSLRHGLDTE
jgi:hypothetical protein